MVATVLVNENNGAGETKTQKDGGTSRYKNADDANVDTNNPLVVPTTNTEYSMEKSHRMRIGGTGPDTEITNLEFFMDGAKGWQAGVKLWARAIGTSYVQPGTPTETNDPPQLPVNGTPVAATDAFTYTSGSPLSLGAGPYSTINTDMGDYLQSCMEVEIGATQGTQAGETATFRYDEL